MKRKNFSLRACIALLLCLGLMAAVLPAAGAAFADITDGDVAAAVADLQSLGIISGTSETTYAPNDPLTRAQVCKIIISTMGIADQAASQGRKNLFSDVLPSAWYTCYVNLAYSKNIINGYGNGTFGPNDHITYGQLATILLRMLGYSTKDIGSFWPIDYTEFCEKLGIHGNLQLDPYAVLNRGQAAILVRNALLQNTASGSKAYYETISGVSSVRSVMLLDADAADGTAEDLVMACVLSGSSANVEYFERVRPFPAETEGRLGALLLNREGKAIGFVTLAESTKDVVIASAKSAGLTDENGITHRIGSSAVTIVKDSVQQWGATGHLLLNGYAGRTARLFYNDNGTVAYVYLLSGKTTATTVTAVAQTDEPYSRFLRELGISYVSGITKNGAPAAKADLAKNDVAYYDAASQTLRVSDFRVSGAIEAVSPTMENPSTITVAGCALDVLESAWDDLAACKLYDTVTLLLTDDCKVAAVATDETQTEMLGVLSQNGNSVTLCTSGLTLTAGNISAEETLRGKLVKVTASGGYLACTAYTAPIAERLDMTARTLGEYKLAPSCKIYEHAGSSGSSMSYLCSLSGEVGTASTDFEEIFWTETLGPSAVSAYHLNSAGQVDVLLLRDVTGNCYEYGYTQRQTKNSTAAITLKNGSGSKRITCNLGGTVSAYSGIAQRRSVSGQMATAYVKLTAAGKTDGSGLSQNDGKWFLSAGGNDLPVSENVQIYLAATDTWLSGESGLQAAFLQGLPVTVYHDRTLTTGAQVRVMVVEKEA